MAVFSSGERIIEQSSQPPDIFFNPGTEFLKILVYFPAANKEPTARPHRCKRQADRRNGPYYQLRPDRSKGVYRIAHSNNLIVPPSFFQLFMPIPVNAYQTTKIEVRLTRVPIRSVKFAGSGEFAHRKQINPYYNLPFKANPIKDDIR
jgi:hypothetical protein